MQFSRVALSTALVIAALSLASEATAEQYQFMNDQGQFVASSELPPLGTSYAVLDDNGVYQYLVHSVAQVSPKIEWQVSTVSDPINAVSLFSIFQAPLASDDALAAGSE